MLEISLIDTQTNLDYSIRYDETTNSVNIHVKHNTEFIEWSKTITNNLTNGTSENIKVSLTPKNVYNILNDYANGVLSPKYKVVMPNTFKVDTSLPIEIHSTMEYQDDQDVKTISLDPIDIPIEKRFDLKLAKILQAERRTLLEQVEMSINLRLTEIETRFEAKLEQKDRHIETLNAKIVELENTCNIRVEDLTERFYNVTSEVQAMFIVTHGLSTDMDKLTTRIDTAYTEFDTAYTKFTPVTTFDELKSNYEGLVNHSNMSIKTALDGVLHLNNANLLLSDRVEELSKKVDGCVESDAVYTKKESDAKFSTLSDKHESDIRDQTERITVIHSLAKTANQSLIHQNNAGRLLNDQLKELSTKIEKIYTKEESDDRLLYAVKLVYNKIVTNVIRPIATKHLFKMLQWFCANNHPSDKIACRKAVEQDRFDVLKWLHESGCSWDESACTWAARKNRLDILKYLHENGCPWDESACAYASINKHSEITKYLHENACPCDKITSLNCNDNVRPIFPLNDYFKKFMKGLANVENSEVDAEKVSTNGDDSDSDD